MLSVLLPENSSEAELKTLMHDIDKVCEQLQIEVIGGHTEVTKAVNQIIVTVTGIGKMKKPINKDSRPLVRKL